MIGLSFVGYEAVQEMLDYAKNADPLIPPPNPRRP